MGNIVNRGFRSNNPMENGPMMGGQMQQNQMQSMQNMNPSDYMPPMDMQQDYQPLSAIPQGAADEGNSFAQQASMFRDAKNIGQMSSPYGDNSQNMMSSLGELLGLGGNGGNPVYDEAYGNPQQTMQGNPYGSFPMQFPLANDTRSQYGSLRRPMNLGSLGQL